MRTGLREVGKVLWTLFKCHSIVTQPHLPPGPPKVPWTSAACPNPTPQSPTRSQLSQTLHKAYYRHTVRHEICFPLAAQSGSFTQSKNESGTTLLGVTFDLGDIGNKKDDSPLHP